MSKSLTDNQTYKIMAAVKRSVCDYLQDQLDINQAALKAYDGNTMEDANRDAEVKRYREIEAMKIRDRVSELSKHIAVIKRMYPDA